MAWSTHLHFAGDCREAFRCYAELLGGRVTMFTYGDTPMAKDVSVAWREKVVHATLSLDGRELAGSDVAPPHYRRPQGFAVLVDVAGVAAAQRVFDVLAAGGAIAVPMQATFWSPAFGVVTDRFGIPWEINGRPAA